MSKNKTRTEHKKHQREYCLQKEGTNQFMHFVAMAPRPISDDDLMRTATYRAQRCSGLYGGNWIAHVGMTYSEMAEQRQMQN